MKYNSPIQVFEHGLLNIDKHRFTKAHWEKLGWYNDRHSGRFFSLTPNGVKFNQYVGVIQVGNITIEILPKINKYAEDSEKAKWQKVLVDMLRECRWMQVHSHEKASLKFKSNSILETYLNLFLVECESILRQGLVKKYRSVSSNRTNLKGKLLFPQQIQKNLVHQERCYTQYQVFDRENIFNQILFQALQIIPHISQHPLLRDRVYNLLLSFPELKRINITHTTFKNLNFDRRTNHYKEAMEIAAMLLLNFRPDIRGGHNNVFAILFDMNDLWEEYIFRQLHKQKPDHHTVVSQSSKKFWELNNSNISKKIRPDIIITNIINKKIFILDTKWKLLPFNIPADDDLKQMYVYNEYWQSRMAILVYPHSFYTTLPECHTGFFNKKHNSSATHGCGIMKISVLNENSNSLDKSIGKRMHDYLETIL